MWKNLIKNKVFWAIIIILVGIVSVYFFTRPEKPAEFVLLKKGDIIQSVSATGKVVAAKDVNLAFETQGTLANIYISVGQKVKRGDVLMSLNISELLAKQKEAESALESARAKLNQVLAGTKPEEIAVYQAAFDNARVSLLNNEKLYLNTSDIALSVSKSVVLDNTLSAALSVNNQTLSIEQQFLRQIALFSYSNAKSAVNKADSSNLIDDILMAYDKVMINLKDVQGVLEKVSAMLDATPQTLTITQTYLDTAKSTINTQRSNISNAIVSLTSIKATLEDAQTKLNLKKSGATKEEIELAQSQVKEAEASLNLIKEQIKKSYIIAPFDGIVGGTENSKVGEYVVAGNAAVSILSTNNFQIEADITEIDIPKIKIGDPANITFDALGKDMIWQGYVVGIESSSKTIEGVVYYKVTIDFNEGQKLENIKSGMSANIDVITGKKQNILILSQRLIYEKDGQKFIKILKDDKTIEEREIKTALSGNGLVEIASGAQEGEKVLIEK